MYIIWICIKLDLTAQICHDRQSILGHQGSKTPKSRTVLLPSEKSTCYGDSSIAEFSLLPPPFFGLETNDPYRKHVLQVLKERVLVLSLTCRIEWGIHTVNQKKLPTILSHCASYSPCSYLLPLQPQIHSPPFSASVKHVEWGSHMSFSCQVNPATGRQWEDRWEEKETTYFLPTPSSLPQLHVPAGTPSCHWDGSFCKTPVDIECWHCLPNSPTSRPGWLTAFLVTTYNEPYVQYLYLSSILTSVNSPLAIQKGASVCCQDLQYSYPCLRQQPDTEKEWVSK